MSPVTASSWWLAKECVYPWTSGIPWPRPAKPSWAATLGTIAHALIEHEIDSANGTPHVPRIPAGTARQMQLAHAAKRLAVSWLAARGTHGVQLAVSPEQATGYSGGVVIEPRRLHVHRDYGALGKVSIAGTADLVITHKLPDGSVWHTVHDWKTGLYAEPYTSRAKDQITCLSALLPYGSVRDGSAVYLDGRTSHVREVLVPVDGLEIAVTRAKFAAVEAALLAKQGPKPGMHCSSCPIRTRCKEYGGQ